MTAYVIRMSDLSSDVCSYDLLLDEYNRNWRRIILVSMVCGVVRLTTIVEIRIFCLNSRKLQRSEHNHENIRTFRSMLARVAVGAVGTSSEIGIASSRERVCQYV